MKTPVSLFRLARWIPSLVCPGILVLLQNAHAALLAPPTAIVSGIHPEKWVHVADLDDGRGSILYSPEPGNLVLLRRNAMGYDAPLSLISGGGVARVLGAQTADLNGNGYQDIVAALELTNGQLAIRVLYRNIFGTYFVLDPDYLPGGVPARQAPLLLVDLDRDGRTDIMTCWKTSATGTAKGRAGWFRNLGGNDFGGVASLFLATFDEPCSLSAEDFTGDGAPDFTVADNGRSEVRIFPGPSFLAPSTISTAVPPQRLLAQNDGTDRWPDLLVLEGYFNTLNNQVLRSYANTGGTFGAGQALGTIPSHSGNFLATDLDLDGHRDFVFVPDDNLTHGLLVGPNNGGLFLTNLYLTAVTTDPLRAAAVFDDDHDGDPDLVAVSDGSLVRFANTFGHRLALSRRSYRYSANNVAPQTVSAILAVDLNHDGKDDAVTASAQDGAVRVYFNAAGQVTAGPVVTTKAGVRFLASGDLDRDGDQDLVLSSLAQNRVVWFENNGAGTAWVEHIIPDVLSIPTSVAVGDVNGDGHPDIVAASAASQNVHLLTNTGAGAGWAISTVGSGVDPGNIRIADVIGGGRPEIIVQRGNNSGIVIYRYTNSWTATELAAGVSGATGQGLAIADLSGDGRLDIGYGSGIAVWALIQDASGTFGAPEFMGIGFDLANSNNTDNVLRSLQAADLDRDGVSELIATFRYSGMVLSRGRSESGRATSQTPFLTNAAVEPGDTAPLDLNGDGVPDLFRRDPQSSRIAVDLTAAIHHRLSVYRLPAFGDAATPYNVLSQTSFGMVRIEAQTYAWPSDGPVPLNGFRLRFLQHASPFQPLTGTAVAGIFGDLSVRDDADQPGTFDPQSDFPLLTVATPAADANGEISLLPPVGAVNLTPYSARNLLVTGNTTTSTGWAIQVTVPALPFQVADPDKRGYANDVLMTEILPPLHLRSQTPTPLQSWRYSYFFDFYSQGRAGNDIDFDHDGVSNLLEYCLGTNPKIRDRSPFTTDLFGQAFFLGFPERDSGNAGARLTLTASTDLKVWQERAYRAGAQAWVTTNATLTESFLNANQNLTVISVLRKAAENFRLHAWEIAH
jgi:hypothetical protein